MSSKETWAGPATPLVLGVGLLLLTLYKFGFGQWDKAHAVGFVCGAAGAVLAGLLLRARGAGRRGRRFIAYVAAPFSPLGIIVLLQLPAAYAGGYLVGGAATFCFGYSFFLRPKATART